MHAMIFKKYITQIKHPPDKYLQFDSYSQLTKKKFFDHDMLNIAKMSNDNNKKEEENTPKKRCNQQIIEKLLNYNVDINNLPHECLSRKKNPSHLYLLNRDGAKQFASAIVQDVLENNAPVLEMQPGLGFLTQELLNAGVPHIFLYERIVEFIKVLKSLLIKYPDRLDLRQHNLLNSPRIAYIDYKTGSNKFKSLFSGIEPTNYEDKPSMQIIGAMPNITLPVFISSTYPEHYFEYKRVVFYVVILPSMSLVFDDVPDNTFHTPKNIYLRTKFDYKFLDEIPREYFFPNPSPVLNRKRNVQYYLDDNKKMYLVKIESKQDFTNNEFTEIDWYYFLSFLRLNMTRRQSRIIPALEKWIPGCGRILIKHNFNIYSRFSELKSPELLNLYNIFRAMPEYKTCPFISITQSRTHDIPEVDVSS